MVPKRLASWAWLLVVAAALALLPPVAGCAGSGTITGKVTYQGRPLTGGTVLFTSTRGRGTRTAQIGEDGTYTITDMPGGPVKIAVETKSAQPVSRPEQTADGKHVGGPPPGAAVPGGMKPTVYGDPSKVRNAEPIPEDYADPDKSGLNYTVKRGRQEFPIELK
jgi:hypothetical protein